MAEYDNLLARAELVIRHAREDADGWEAASKELTGRQHFSFAGVALMLRDVAQVAEDLRALQTENTELREKAVEADRSARSWIRESIDLTEKLQTAERTIHEARLLSDVFGIYEKLSSYPLGEGQTPKLDPYPFVRKSSSSRLSAFGVDLYELTPDEAPFDPRPEYSQKRADYEGQTQQGDER